MNPDIEPIEPIPIDPPDNTSKGANLDADPAAAQDAEAPAINPPDNT